MKHLVLFLVLTLLGCPGPTPPPPVPDAAPFAVAPTAASSVTPVPLPPTKAVSGSSTLAVANDTDRPVFVFVAFGANSAVLPTSTGWEFCKATAKLNCEFGLGPKNKLEMPLGGKYLNATFSFAKPVTCETTKAEMNLNNPAWYDVTDVSLVDGYNLPVAVDIKDANGPRTLGPALPTGNEKAFGVYPLSCDVCVARQSPPCGAKPGKNGCKGGTQFAPDVPCQYQGPTMSGGSAVVIRLLAGVPLK